MNSEENRESNQIIPAGHPFRRASDYERRQEMRENLELVIDILSEDHGSSRAELIAVFSDLIKRHRRRHKAWESIGNGFAHAGMFGILGILASVCVILWNHFSGK